MDGAGLEQPDFPDRRLAQAQHQVGGAEQRLAVGAERGAGGGVVRIGKTTAESEARFHFHLGPEFDQFGGAGRR